MIVISSGFPKSASTLLFLYTEHLLERTGKSRGQKIFRRINKEGFTPWFGPLNTPFYVFASLFGPVVIKTHSGPGFFVRMLIALGLARAYYSVRDPRDVVLSALDHGASARKKTQQTDSDRAFAPFHKTDDLVPALDMHLDRYLAWKKYGRVLFVRYEDLIQQPEHELERVTSHIGRKDLAAFIPETVKWFAERKTQTINFNKGTVVRYKSEMSREEIASVEKQFGKAITAMDYQLSAS